METHPSIERDDVIRIVLVAIASALTWFHVWEPMAQVDLLAVIAVVVGGFPIYREAFEAMHSSPSHNEAGELVRPLFDGKPKPHFYEVVMG